MLFEAHHSIGWCSGNREQVCTSAAMVRTVMCLTWHWYHHSVKVSAYNILLSSYPHNVLISWWLLYNTTLCALPICCGIYDTTFRELPVLLYSLIWLSFYWLIFYSCFNFTISGDGCDRTRDHRDGPSGIIVSVLAWNSKCFGFYLKLHH